jgi:hypothetical protein
VPSPRYTYLGAGYDWGDSKCGVELQNEGVSGYTAEGSLGVFSLLHVIGSYYDGETDGSTSLDLKCYELGAGLSYSFAPGADIVLRGSYVKVESDDVSGDADGFEPELLVRYMISDKTEIHAGMAYYDIEDDDNLDVDNSEIRLGLVYNVLPWLALRAGGVVFDDDTSVNAGVRINLGNNLF